MRKRVALPGLALGAALGAGLAGRATIRRWASNDDPFDGAGPPLFPRGHTSTVDTDDGARLVVERVGEGPTVVLVHGLTASRREWGPIAEHLLDGGLEVVAFDQRGHGESTAGSAGYGSARLGRDLACVFDALDLDDAVLVGQSMGGMAAMSFAVDHPQAFGRRVDALALVATAGSLAGARSQAALRVGSIPVPDAIAPADERLRLGTGLLAFGAEPSLPMVDEAIAMVRACPEPVRAAATAALVHHDVLRRLGDVDVPTAVIGGTRDQLVRPRQVRELADAIPGAVLTMFRDAGHMLIWERHREVADKVIELARSRGVDRVAG